MRVLILGCGPAGLLACHAAAQTPNTQPIILSRKRPSQLHGCQYLHENIPGIPQRGQRTIVNYRLSGTAEQYHEKVYGSQRLPSLVSPQLYQGPRPAWDLRAAYAWLWKTYQDLIIDGDLIAGKVREVIDHFAPDRVISTVPAPLLCERGEEHLFSSVRCWAIGEAPDQRLPWAIPDNTVECNGLPEVGWYRAARVFGVGTIEWPGRQRKPPISGVVAFDKPLSTNCDCLPMVRRLGRYGRWRKGVLAHHAYSDAMNMMRAGRADLPA